MELSDPDLKITMLKELKDRIENFNRKLKMMKNNQIETLGIKIYNN